MWPALLFVLPVDLFRLVVLCAAIRSVVVSFGRWNSVPTVVTAIPLPMCCVFEFGFFLFYSLSLLRSLSRASSRWSVDCGVCSCGVWAAFASPANLLLCVRERKGARKRERERNNDVDGDDDDCPQFHCLSTIIIVTNYCQDNGHDFLRFYASAFHFRNTHANEKRTRSRLTLTQASKCIQSQHTHNTVQDGLCVFLFLFNS